MYKYEKVTDLNHNEIAKAMIDGEVFYSEDGQYACSWNGECFISKHSSECTCEAVVVGHYYRKVKYHWTDKLDGTIENGVLCWVNDGGDNANCITLIIAISGSASIDSSRIGWKYATPLTHAEIQQLLNNAPEDV